MNGAIKRVLFSAIAVILLLNACAPAAAATSESIAGEDSTVAQLIQTVEALSTAQNQPDPENVALKQTIEALVATRTAEPEQSGILRMLSKPFSPRDILARVQALLDPQPAHASTLEGT